MLKRIVFLAAFITIASLAMPTVASPKRNGIAINETTRECGAYWAGDENTSYTLPVGWKDYYAEDQRIPGTCVIAADDDPCLKIGAPMYKCASPQKYGQCFSSMEDCVSDATCASFRIITPVGECVYAINHQKDCCTQLGLTLASDTLIGTRGAITPWTGNGQKDILLPAAGVIGVVSICAVVTMIIRRRTRSKKQIE
ncbi:MAG: hypothetical protein V1907_03855 [Candidatus Kerfeldbacteria bacterium]